MPAVHEETQSTSCLGHGAVVHPKLQEIADVERQPPPTPPRTWRAYFRTAVSVRNKVSSLGQAGVLE
eukprot:1459606-Alexandrium_andersonii.AAC.1